MNLPAFPIAFLRSHWRLLVSVGLILLLIVQTFRLQNTQAALEAERAGRTADRSEYRRAQAEATANALADARKKEAEDAKKANAADVRADDLAARYRALSLQYAAAQRSASGEHLSVPAQAAESPDSPGGSPVLSQGLILIPQADALICADGIARLQAGHEWALGL